MKRYIIYLIILVLPVVNFNSCGVFYNKRPVVNDRTDRSGELNHITGGLFVYNDQSYWQTNSLVYISENGVLFFDAPWNNTVSYYLLYKVSLQTNKEYKGLLLTDYRLHRSGGMKAFQEKDIPIFYSAKTLNQFRSKWDDMQKRYSNDFSSWKKEEAVTPDALLDNKTEFFNGDVIVYQAADSFVPGGLLIYFKKEKALYGGSALSYPLMFGSEVRRKGYINLLQKIMTMDVDIIISGHGKPKRDKDMIMKVLKSLESVK